MSVEAAAAPARDAASAAGSKVAAIAGLDSATYAPSALHAEERVWVEKNCYVDVMIEVLHALGLEPLAVAPFVVAIDFEGDQWTFFKPPHGELWDLYGLDVQELNVWRPLLEHVEHHVGNGRLVSTEVDAHWLPDTVGTDYRRSHTKTTIIVNEIDVAARRLGYFHNARYHALEGDDFAAIFRIGAAPDPAYLPFFAEVLRVDRVVRRPVAELAARSRALYAHHLARRPADNPVARFGERFARDLPVLAERGLEHYHAWAFATIRQLGAAFELAALHARWLSAYLPEIAAAASAYDAVSAGCKTLILKTARAVNAKRPLDARPLFDEMAAAWQRGIDCASAAVAGASPEHRT
ncbi:MAG TPA: DUF1839 family protein [Minicystis sp.]|nr:DUF1839 family protein [Minicystis sp.]